MKALLFISLFLISCSHGDKYGRRHLASSRHVDVNNCQQAYVHFFSGEAGKLYVRESKKFWNKLNRRIKLPRLKESYRRWIQRRKHRLMRLNENQKPIFYIDEDEGSYANIYRFVGDFVKTEDEWDEVKNLGKQGRKQVDFFEESKAEIFNWMERYNKYHQQLDNLVAEVTLKRYYLKQLKGMLKQSNNAGPSFFPQIKEIEFLENGEVVTKKLNIANRDKLVQYIVAFDSRVDEIEGSFLKRLLRQKDDLSFGGVGELKYRQFEQALLAKRLTYLQTEMAGMIENRSADRIPQEFSDLYQELGELLSKEEIKPDVKNIIKLEKRELKAEKRNLKETFDDLTKRVNEKVNEKLGQLSDYEKERLGLNRSGYANLYKYSPYAVIGSALFGGGGGAYYFIGWPAIKNFIFFWRDKAFECVQLEDDDEFIECLYQYTVGKYPKSYLKQLRDNKFRPFKIEDLDSSDPLYKEKKDYMEEMNAIIEARNAYLKKKERDRQVDQDIYDGLTLLLEKSLEELEEEELEGEK